MSFNMLKNNVASLLDNMIVVGEVDELKNILAIATEYKSRGLERRWPQNLQSLKYYKAEEY